MKQFVRVRIVQANAMDLRLFQFDYDLTFAVFFLNADKTIYGRYGTRSAQKEATRDISMASLAKAMAAVLDLHKAYPSNKAALAGKLGPKPRFDRPEQYPSLKRYKPTLDYEGNVVRSCMHCHQVRDAERRWWRDRRQPMPDEVIYPWPMPDSVGLTLDPTEMAKVTRVAPGSLAARAGFRAGDHIAALNGQPILSIADVQWVLHSAGEPSTIRAQVRRTGRDAALTLALPTGWRRSTDISWRTTSWNLRRMLGGMKLSDLSDAERRRRGLAPSAMALHAEHVGQYGEHAVAKRQGFRKGDIIVSFDGKTDRMSETDLFAYVVRRRMPGTRVPATVLRGNRRMQMTLPMQ